MGLLYGPSGCGKSSLVKAGLLPRLGPHVLPVYIETTPEGTEIRLLNGVRKVCPDLPTGLGLVESLGAVRKGRVLRSHQKLLLVLDQFEQWLHGKRGKEGTELIAALRQCDGEHVQGLVMVRDDFWMATTRFMKDVEIDLEPDSNVAAVDLFDLQHARRVLVAFGRAYGTLPDGNGEVKNDQEAFLDRTVAGLAQDGRIIPVRLALFAEMLKGKPWSQATLREIGGTEGVGVTFLEETFGSPRANPNHRLHQAAARAALKAFLPEGGADIKGLMRSREELLEASGYVNRSGDFDELIRILDPELRLITPTDPEGSGGDRAPASPGGRYYQLTHDYLVPSLRDWLTRKQRETRRGRAELRLAERADLWNAKPENRRLPSPLEWARIRLLTRDTDWTVPQRRMMRRAGRVHGLRGVVIVALLTAGLLAGLAVRRRVIETQEANEAASLVQRLLVADTPQVPEIVRAMRDHRRRVDPSLRDELERASDHSREKLHASLALLPVDAAQVDFLFDRLVTASTSELPVLCDALKPHRSALTPRLWEVPGEGKAGRCPAPPIRRHAGELRPG